MYKIFEGYFWFFLGIMDLGKELFFLFVKFLKIKIKFLFFYVYLIIGLVYGGGLEIFVFI